MTNEEKIKQIDDYKIEAQAAERAGNYGKVAELRYGKMAEAQKKIDELTAKRQAITEPIITEAVTPEDIAEVVAKWTGIPVKRMLESEKDKLLRMESELHKRVVGQDEAIHDQGGQHKADVDEREDVDKHMQDQGDRHRHQGGE